MNRNGMKMAVQEVKRIS